MVDNRVKTNSSEIEEFLQNLGLSVEEAAVYLSLTRLGTTSTINLARTTAIPRTNIYRILEKLKNLGLVEEVVEEKRKLSKAARPVRLKVLLDRQREKVAVLERVFPQVQSLLGEQIAGQQPGTEVLFYRGTEGLEQQVWNELQAKVEIVGYTLLAMEDIIGKKLAQKYREERMIRNIKCREILADDDRYLNEKTLKYARRAAIFKNYDWRYLPKKKLAVTHNLMIYDDIVSFYNWAKGEIFGVEIHNTAIAKMQREIFKLLWEVAKKPETLLKRWAK